MMMMMMIMMMMKCKDIHTNMKVTTVVAITNRVHTSFSAAVGTDIRKSI